MKRYDWISGCFQGREYLKAKCVSAVYDVEFSIAPENRGIQALHGILGSMDPTLLGAGYVAAKGGLSSGVARKRDINAAARRMNTGTSLDGIVNSLFRTKNFRNECSM
jgi:hypothetical protein